MSLICALTGHDDALGLRQGRIFVACAACGRESCGVEIGPPRYAISQPGATVRVRARILHRLQRAYYAYAREHQAAA